MSTTLLPIRFGGVEEGADPKALPPGTLLLAENYAMDKGRRLIKRLGTSYLTNWILGGGTITEGARLQTRGKDAVMPAGEATLAYSPYHSQWQKIGRPPSLRITKHGVIDSTRSAISTDVAVRGDLLITATLSGYATPTGLTEKGSALHLTIENIDTGAKVVPAQLIHEIAAWARIHVVGDDVVITYSTVAGEVHVQKFNLETLTLDPNGIVIALSNPESTPCDSAIAIHPTEGEPFVYVVYVNGSSGANRLSVASARISNLDPGSPGAVVTLNTQIGGINSTPNRVSICSSSAGLHVMAGQANPGMARLWTLTGALAVVVGPTNHSPFSTKYVSVQDYDSTRLLVMTCGSDAAEATAHKLSTYLVAKSTLLKVASTERTTWHVAAFTKAWRIDSRWYTLATLVPKDPSMIVNTAIPNASSVVVEIETGGTNLTSTQGSPLPHMGTAETMTAWFPTRIGYVPQAPFHPGYRKAFVPAAYRNREPMNWQSIPVGWNLYTVGPAAGDTHRLAVIGRGGLAAAGAPYWLDGASARPYGFAVAPMIVGLTFDSGNGGSVAGSSTYIYFAIYEWRDANGVLHRSTPSPPRAITTGAGTGRVLIRVTTSSLSQKQGPPYTTFAGVENASCGNPVSIAIYRTLANGQNFHRLTLEPEFQVIVNDPTVGYVQTYDLKADADVGAGSPARPLSAQPGPYTGATGTGGELEDVAPPSFPNGIITHGGRLVGIGPDLRTLWFSKDATEDPGIAPGFNEVLTLGFPDDKTALAALDEKLVVFSEDGIDIVYGRGPNAEGGDNDWQVSRLQTDVGCINPRSVETIPMGVVFESTRGIELLTRELKVLWLGKSMEETLRQYPEITSAVLVAEAHEVRFTCNRSDGEDWAGIVLAFDYENSIWFTRKYRDTESTSVLFADAALIDGVYHLLTYDGRVYHETTDHKLDGDSHYVETDLRLAPLSPGGNLGWSRIKDVSVLGTGVSPHRLEISQKRNYATTWEPAKVFGEDSPVTQPGPLTRCRRTFPHQKCQAMEVRIRDLAPTNPDVFGKGEGVILEGLAFRVNVQRGPAKTSAGEQG